MSKNAAMHSLPHPLPYPETVVIVGGGTAGWMAANLFLHHWPESQITLIESKSIGTIGVGEGSTPYLKAFFQKLGIADSEWMPACNATYKAGIRFKDWSTVAGFEQYFHPFYSPLDFETGSEFFRQWNVEKNQVHPDNFFVANQIALQALAPVAKRKLTFPVDYGYHFDATLLAQFLKARAITKGLKHIEDTILDAHLHTQTSAEGAISHVRCELSGEIHADFFVDCSGFASFLAEKTLQVPHISYSEGLLNDSAVTISTQHENDQINAETLSTALSAGWSWKIPLTERFGNGYVYSSQFLSNDKAELELLKQLDISESSDVGVRHLKMKIGRLESHWYKNCLAVGLSQGFIEPLEATALMLTQFTLDKFFDLYDPQKHIANNTQQRLNQSVNTMMEGIRDYIQAHYVLNTRTDTPYWAACREVKVSDTLEHILYAWEQGELDNALETLSEELAYLRPSWYVILAGMGKPQNGINQFQPTNNISENAVTQCQRLARDTFMDHTRLLRQYSHNAFVISE